MKKSSPKGRIIKAPFVDESCLNRFCLLDIETYEEIIKEKEEREEEEAERSAVREDTGEAKDKETEPVVPEEVLEEEKKKAYEEGFKKGYDEGFAKGIEKGKKEGFEKGYAEGLSKGVEEGKRQGFEQGFSQGRKEGFVEGKSEGRRLIEERYKSILENAEKHLGELERLKKAFEERIRSVEEILVDSIILAVKKLFFVIPERDMVLGMVRECVERLSEDQKAKIRLNPKDYKLVEGHIDVPSFVEVVPDESIRRGGCVVELETGSVETSLKERLEEFEEIVLKKLNGE